MGANIRNWQHLGDSELNLLYSTEGEQAAIEHLALMVKRNLIEDWDFIGFKFNGYHSISDLHIYRVSDGSRYNDTIIPNMTDKTADIPGRDGMYFFNTKYTQKQFTINFVYEHLTETDLRKLRQVFDGKEIHELVFDEHPYKVWAAKVTGSATLKFLCFDSYDGGSNENYSDTVDSSTLNNSLPEYTYGTDNNPKERIYRGEGSIQFTCYYPYAHTPSSTNEFDYGAKTKSDFEDYANVRQWIVSSGLPDQREFDAENQLTGYYKKDTTNNKEYYYNYGDIPSYFKVRFKQNDNYTVVSDLPISIGKNPAGQFQGIIIPAGAVFNEFEWDSRTGIVRAKSNTDSNMKPIQFRGSSILTIPVTLSERDGVEVQLPENFKLYYDFWYL